MNTKCAVCQKDITETGTMYNGQPVHIQCYHRTVQPKEFTSEDILKAVHMARLLVEGKEEFDIEGLMGLTEICTHNMDVKYTKNQILKLLKNNV